MSSTLRLEDVHAQSRTFVQHHGLSFPSPGTELALGDPRGSGAFGVVYPVETASGTPPLRPLLVKAMIPSVVQQYGGPGTFISRVAALHRTLERNGEPKWPDALLALPFAIASGQLAGKTELVTLMLDLEPLGYESIQFGERDENIAYRGRQIRQRIDFAVRFAQRMALLEAVSFVHGDLNPENLLFDSAGHDVQVIDLDAGAVVDSGRERPLTAGKPGPCIPPEAKNSGTREPVDVKRYTGEAERWSVGSLVGTILYGVHPGFFLGKISARTLDAYAKSGRRWPQIDTSSDHFTVSANQADAYRDTFLSRFESAPGGTGELFARLFAAGSDGSLRPTAADWLAALREACEPPVFEFLRVDRDVVPEGTEVQLSWATRDAEQVESPQLGTLEPSGSARVVMERSTRFALTAINPYGSTSMTSPAVRVMPLPRLRAIPIRDFPRLSLDSRIVVPPPSLATASISPPLFADRIGIPRHSPTSLSRHLPMALPLPPLPYIGALVEPLLPDLAAVREGELP